MFYTPDFNESGLWWDTDEIATRTVRPVEVCMSRMFALCVLLVGLQSGCAAMKPAYASQYCLTTNGGPCEQMAGDGFCQPCPDAQPHQAGAMC
jgi:hypothetical protein